MGTTSVLLFIKYVARTNHILSSRRISGIKPGNFRPGQIVSIGVSFRLVKSRQNDQLMFLSHLDSLTLLSWGVRKVSEEQFLTIVDAKLYQRFWMNNLALTNNVRSVSSLQKEGLS